MAEVTKKKATISVPSDLYEAMQAAIKGKGFRTVDDYATYVLHMAVAKDGGKKKEAAAEPYNAEDEKKITDRLKALGYV